MITGEVNTSGIHKYVPGKRLRYYLKLSGGLRPDADKSNIWVAYPNGDSKKYNHFSLFSPKVIDGSSIVVGKEKEEEPFDRTEFAKEVTAILANLAQTVAVVALAYR
jgi:protein involved in polysaccharide export with SLBB domain